MSADPERDGRRNQIAEFKRLLGALDFDDVAEALHEHLARRVAGGVDFGQHFGDYYTLLEAVVVYRKARREEARTGAGDRPDSRRRVKEGGR